MKTKQNEGTGVSYVINPKNLCSQFRSSRLEGRGSRLRMIEGSEKAGLKLNIQNTKIMASGSVTSWQVEGEKVEAVTDFIFLGSKITADSNCSHEIKRHLLLGRKAMTNLDSVLKSKGITLPTKVCLVKAVVFPGVCTWLLSCDVMWELDLKEGWMPKNWCFWIVLLEKTLESPLDGKEIKTSWS